MGGTVRGDDERGGGERGGGERGGGERGERGGGRPAVPEEAEGLRAAVITCSDSVAAGTAVDASGPLAADLLVQLGHAVSGVRAVADDEAAIRGAVEDALADGALIVVLTGGTGASPRDVTPDALRAMGLRELPGLGEAIRAASRDRVPTADLSRALGGVLGAAVVLALPGSPGGVRDGLAAVGGLLAHAAAMAGGEGHGAPQPTLRSHAVDSNHFSVGIDYTAGELVRDAPIAEADVADVVSADAAGAVITFAGVVRDHDRGRAVVALRYEGHPDAGRVLAEVVAEARVRPGVLGAAALHRVGELAVGDLAFVAAVSAAHRREAFEACAWLVDEAKARLPIWKHQRFADGTSEWVNCP